MKLSIDNVYIINLDKDTQRLDDVLNQCSKVGITSPKRIKGIYGKNLTSKELKDDVDFFYSKTGLASAIGCAMSHIKAWETMIENDDDCALFLEDDIFFSDDFKNRMNTIDFPDDFGIIYLGCTIGCDVSKNYGIEYPMAKLIIGNRGKFSKKVVKINDNVYIPSLPLALHGYILSKKGANHLINCIKKDKIHHHIDAQILKYIYDIPSYSVSPQLIFQKDVDIHTSNNINSQYPVILNKLLNIKDQHGVPLNYKLNIGHFEICGYIVNCFTVLMLLTGIIIGLFKIKPDNILIGFMLFSVLEIALSKISKDFVIHSIVSYILILTGVLITEVITRF